MINIEGYQNFNTWVFKEYFEHALGSYSSVASVFIDIDKANGNENILEAYAYLATCDWQHLCGFQKDGIPLYLGLVAIQLLAASARQDDELCSASAYNPRLREKLSITDNILQRRYGEGQDKIYDHFEKWCNQHSLAIYLSRRITSGPGRYCQYPLSLALLHRKDIESLGLFFHDCKLAPDDEIDFEWFQRIVRNRIRNFSPLQRKWLRFDKGREEAALKQMYAAYLSWDGYYAETNEKRKSHNPTQAREYGMYWAAGDEPCPEFLCNDKEIPYRDIPGLNKRGCFFVQDPGYPKDWQLLPQKQVGSENDRQYAFVCITASSLTEALKEQFDIEPFCYESLRVYTLSSAQIGILATFLPNMFAFQPAIRLSGGIKLGYRIWMENAGPMIDTDHYRGESILLGCLRKNSPKEWKTLKISERPLVHLKEGRYFLQYSPDAALIHFEIASPLPYENTDWSNLGWALEENGFHVSDTPCIRGLDFSGIPPELLKIYAASPNTGNPIRQWLRLSTGQAVEKIDNENLIHQVLKRGKHGIRNR